MSALSKLGPAQQRVVRTNVRALLADSDAFRNLPAEEQRALANRMVNVVAFLADPATGHAPALSVALAEPNKPPKNVDKELVQADFTAKAAREGADVYKDLVNAIDFPDFVSGLIDGVFNSIVDASIRQMEAYSTLLANVAKSVDEFAKDNFTLNQGRDYLAGRFPSQLQISVENQQPRLSLTDSAEDGGLDEITNTLGLQSAPDLDDEASEAELARRGQLEMAKLRQKQLATMVLMGINRIVVTDGAINAKVIVDVQTHDTATRANRASTYDSNDTRTRTRTGGGWFSDGSTDTQTRHRTLVSSATSDTSTSDVETKAKLTGEVRVNFKSETFPLERLASQTELEAVNQASQ
jgi:hypothetical protein